ncbi:hypothetical protein CDES_11035 [Corynebacterium deserti GIMN1.010]|uniref:Uncharacterized protein n=1 Tax=Corynebacterium deserti GIMN1.010 TaxID=931089 RepID=A0A0M4CR73_9CORY|nr:hypothetical protein [Corynebacterium deserti]ALC06580.1 hypothetical protein CDES_11035 [Corynebacterium deserti GIMN1.010]
MSAPRKTAGKTFIGKPKTGGSSRTLALMSIGSGAVLAAVGTALIVALTSPTSIGVTTSVYFLAMLPIFVAFAWIILVDRDTIKGAVRNPEQSIENVWYSAAAQDTFHVLMVAGGIGCVAFTIRPLDVPLSLVFLVLVVFLQVVFWICYGLRKRVAA